MVAGKINNEVMMILRYLQDVLDVIFLLIFTIKQSFWMCFITRGNRKYIYIKDADFKIKK